jgi:tetratricopeptide (TPR) repeat protein
MEYAYSRGIRAHRDLKPANIMIGYDNTVRITDFGLAGIIKEEWGGGTPAYMPAEQFTNPASCDERSDIYSFGVVLYQMVTGGDLPFRGLLRDLYRLHRDAPVPTVESPLAAVIARCLEKEPAKRYQSFRDLRSDLEPHLKQQTGQIISPPELSQLDAWEWSNKGASLNHLGHYAEALECCDKALAIIPYFAGALVNKGTSFLHLNLYNEAIQCYDMALQFEPFNANAWIGKGTSFDSLGQHAESIGNLESVCLYGTAIQCYDEALRIDHRRADAWRSRGVSLNNLRRDEQAIPCFDKALEIVPQYGEALVNKGRSLCALCGYEEALECCDKALEIDPLDINAWIGKGASLVGLERDGEAIQCYNEALKINPQNAFAQLGKKVALTKRR